jgi:hypothetical protein
VTENKFRARFELSVDGAPRAYHHDREQAIKVARSLKGAYPDAGVTVRDVESGEMLVILKRKPELSPHQQEALRYLARGGGRDRRIDPRGITIGVLNGLVDAGLATKIVETLVHSGRHITRGWEITPAGREALRGAT